MKRIPILALAALCALLAALPALAAGDDARPASPYPQPMSAEQQKALMTIQQKYEKNLFDLGQQLYQKRAELNAVLAAKEPDEKKARALSADIGKLLGEQYAERSAMEAELRKKGLSPGYGGYGYGRGYHMGSGGYGMMGPGQGPGMMGPGMMGPGMMGPGMMGPGMMGPGMMGPGMMGPGYGPGYGPGMMGPGYGPGYGGPDGN